MKPEKLENILKIAKEMFNRYGLKKTSMDEIARKARVAKGTIYNYFGSKDRVFLEVLSYEANDIIEKITLAVDKEVTPEAQLAAFIHAKFRYIRQGINYLNLNLEGVEDYPPNMKSIRNDYFELEIVIIDTILREGIKKEVFKLNNPLLTARAIGHALKGFELNWLAEKNEEQIDSYLAELLNLFLFGLMVDKKIE